MSAPQVFRDERPLVLEGGGVVPTLEIAYHTYGRPTPAYDNVVWVCHALTGSSDAAAWWDGLIGPGKVIDTDRSYVVCANMLGSCYGSTEVTISTAPLITIRDQVRAFIRLREHLQIPRIRVLIGGSMGGQHVLEWALTEPSIIDRIIPIATNARHSPWGVAFNAAQRLAIEADPTFHSGGPAAGAAGLAAARAMGMISYRTPVLYNVKQRVEDDRLESFPADTYQRYQGRKLVDRFRAPAYYALTRAMDSHDIGRGRGSAGAALRSISARTLAIGIDTDMLFPEAEQHFIADMVPRARYRRLSSAAGHDAFLIDQRKLATIIHSENIIP